MKSNKYKILVLSDLKDSSDTIIQTTANLAKFTGGDIDLLYVKRPVDIVESDNQLSSMRTINRDYLTSKNKIENTIKSIGNELSINYNVIYGNVKQTIKEHIETTNPDIIVMGKKRFNALNLSGDRVTKFVLKKYNGVVLIASNENVLEPSADLSLGIFNHASNEDLLKKLMAYTQKPIKSFKIQKSSNALEQDKSDDATLKDAVEYIFEPNDNAINNLSNYVLKNNIDLLCINRDNNDSNNTSVSGNLDINKMINKLNVSLLLTK